MTGVLFRKEELSEIVAGVVRGNRRVSHHGLHLENMYHDISKKGGKRTAL